MLALLAGCGDLPQPFAGNPGATARRLAQPPPARLAVPPPAAALLPDAGRQQLASAMAEALVAREVPAVADIARKGDWQLAMTADLRGAQVVPAFAVLDPGGISQGAAQGEPIDAAAWAAANPATLHQAADAAAPAIATLLTRIEAARRQSDPNSLINRPARVLVKDVTGAPGDGNQSLARKMREALPNLGQVVQDSAEGSDYIVQGEVKAFALPKNMSRIEIQWIVSSANGKEAGRVFQLNEIPAGTLDHYWGDVAAVAAQEAAGGIRDVILNNAGVPRKDGTS